MVVDSWSPAIKYIAVTGAAYVGFKAIGKLVRSKVFVPMFTVLPDLSRIGAPRGKPKLPGQAVICGGSISGLFAAAAAAEHFESVLVVEAEAWVQNEGTELKTGKEAAAGATGDGTPININPRARVMQYMSTHLIQPVVFATLKEMFPEYEEEVAGFGIKHMPYDLGVHESGVPLAGCSPEDPLILPTSRELFEVLLRRLVKRARPNVQFMAGTVTGLRDKPDASVIDEVYIRAPDGSQVTITKPALVVDATGASQAGYKWLKKCGYNLPDSTRIHYDPKLRYLTFQFRVPPHLRAGISFPRPWDESGLVYTYMPDLTRESRFVSLGVFDCDKVYVLCGGWGVEEVPRSISEVKTFIAEFPAAEPIPEYVFNVLDSLVELAPQSNPSVSQVSVNSCSNILYHSIPAGGLPSNFIAIGDSVMQLDPVFTQGVGKAAVGALCLDMTLRDIGLNTKEISYRFFKLQAERLNIAWSSTKEVDYGFPSTIPVKGEDKSSGQFARWYASYVAKVAIRDPGMAPVIWGARGWLLPPTDLFSPSIIRRIAWLWLTGQ